MPRALLILFALIVAAIFGGPAAVSLVRDIAGRGKRLNWTTLDAELRAVTSDGQPLTPSGAAALAGSVVGRLVSEDAISLARMLRSEGGNIAAKRAKVWVAINDARALGWSLTRLITYSTQATDRGFYGKQQSRRYGSSADPYEIDLAIAEETIAGASAGGDDPTDGSRHFVDGDELAERKSDEWGLERFKVPGTARSDGRADELWFFRG